MSWSLIPSDLTLFHILAFSVYLKQTRNTNCFKPVLLLGFFFFFDLNVPPQGYVMACSFTTFKPLLRKIFLGYLTLSYTGFPQKKIQVEGF